MTKRKASTLEGIITPPPPPRSDVVMYSHNSVNTQLHDEDVPEAAFEEEPALAPRGRTRSSAKTPQGRPTREGDIHRSLYAKPETLDLIRTIAFEERTSAQALYREGLALMLQARGHAKGKSGEDM